MNLHRIHHLNGNPLLYLLEVLVLHKTEIKKEQALLSFCIYPYVKECIPNLM